MESATQSQKLEQGGQYSLTNNRRNKNEIR